MAWNDPYYLASTLLLFFFLFTGLYFARNYWLPLLPEWTPGYERLNSFADDLEAGLSSDNFSLAGNIADGDSRAGLDNKTKREVLRIMRWKRVDFDEARRMWFEKKMAKEGIGADGMPLDPRAVTFS